MAGPPLAGVLRDLCRFAGGEGDDRGDSQLLRQFVAHGDGAAFAALLRRHGPLVFGVCRQILRAMQDAEDAFQATFLVLARKAASIRKQQSLPAWLHRVAVNIARTARSTAARRRLCERQAVAMSDSSFVEATPPPDDWQPLLHEEVNRLPEKYRLPVVLCYLEGRSHPEAAARLGWPVGTVKGRLARARDLLRSRLTRRGLALSGGVAALLPQTAVRAAVSDTLAETTLKAALLLAAGQTASAAASTAAILLTKGALKTMASNRLTVLALFVFGAAVLGLGGALLALRAGGEERPGGQPQTRAPEPPAPPGGPAPKLPADDFGPEVKGLRAKITLPKKKFTVGAEIPVTYTVKNVSKVEQTLWHSGFWPNHLILVRDAGGKEPPLTALGQQDRKAFAPGGDRWKNVAVKVPAGGEDAAYEKYDLAKLYDLSAPGRYTVQYIYEEKQGGWEGRLPSNEAAFEVVAREEKDGMAESKPERARGLEFVALVPKGIPVPPPAGTQEVALGLRVTNVSDQPVNLGVNDVISLRLVSPDGAQMEMNSRRKDTPKRQPPVLLRPGDTWTWQPDARLEWSGGDRRVLTLSGPDGRGIAGAWSFSPVKQGKHRLAIEYANSNPRDGDAALWVGKATTKEVEFEIVPRENREPGEKPAVRPAEDAGKDDLKKLQGTWRLVAAEEGGKAVPPQNFGRDTHWVFDGTKATFTSGKRVLTGTVTLDPAKDPRWIDLTVGKDFVLRGIYELKGDTLRLSLPPAGAERPTEFRTREGTQQALATYERDKTDPK
jgi:RNA polymerase sigma factor (sigma-70 family)